MAYGRMQTFQVRRRITPVVKALLWANAGVFLLQILGVVDSRLFALSVDGLRRWHVWQLVSYMFIHADPLHLFFNCLFLFFMGPDTERTMGSRRFSTFYLLCGVLAGIAWLIITAANHHFSHLCVGASGAIYGVLGAFAAFFPDRPITLLLFFILPVTLRARILAFGLAALSFLYLLMHSGGQIAHAAHLGGILAGYVYGRALLRAGLLGGYYRPPRPPERTGLFWRGPRFRVIEGGKQDVPSAREVDAILDKIAAKGVESLTRQERRILRDASKSMQAESDNE